ncbi:CobW family GTP-binding protein [Paenibacillus sp. 1001270B_150601_E10]|uniref:CobW family GTP-binding protein n=1 Tax=Paenibacillus sp. 1001270B_150601_E10 TaxID=2787079 RepID=UPI00189F952F|nr:GTP-binding protein [Paenibacillus sp. 1001270B_150601_E10]
MSSSTNIDKPTRHDIPVVILSGFLGSGKTTLLKQLVDWSMEEGLTPAVIMNEVGDVNLDGQMLPENVQMEELLGGCICCSVRGDFGLKLYELVLENTPDVIYVECTGIAEPMEIVDALTEVSIYAPVQLTSLISLADAAQLSEQVLPKDGQKGSTKLKKLVIEQIRSAHLIVLNKCDLVEAEEVDRIEQGIREWNAKAALLKTSHAKLSKEVWIKSLRTSDELAQVQPSKTHDCGCQEHQPDPSCSHSHSSSHHHSHDFVTVWTHAIAAPVNSERFEQWLNELPKEVYRAKGIVRFTDTTKRYMFQFAYRATEFIPIMPQGDVDDVIVVIGEQMDAAKLEHRLKQLIEESD